MPGARLEVKDIVAGYGKMEILHGVSIKADPGEFIAIVGPNGSGKSTLLKTIFGLTNIFGGSVLLDGKDITRVPPNKRPYMGMAYVPQTDNVFPNLTIEENLWLSAYPIKERRKAAEKIEEVLELFPRLRERLKQKAGTLSGGERQMLAMARALITDPKVVLLDEPTAGLAPKIAEQVFRKIVEINEKMSITVILVEQNAKRALEISERCYILVQGKVAFEGPSREVLSHPELGKIYLGLKR